MKWISAVLILWSLHICGQEKQNFPYELRTGRELVLSGVGLAGFITGGLLYLDRQGMTMAHLNGLSTSGINRFDRSAVNYYSTAIAGMSDITVSTLATGSGIYLLADKRLRSRWLIMGTMYGQTLLYTGALGMLSKSLIVRERPYVYNNLASVQTKLLPDATRSFFSSHTAFAFASVSFLSRVLYDCYPAAKWRWLVWAGGLVSGLAVGYMRYRAGKHFPTDIMAGAAVGISTGWSIPLLHRRKD